MDERRALRASDSDREAAVARLRAALNEGRLNVHEYDDRMARAYQAVTYGDLADLFIDLPDHRAGGRTVATRPAGKGGTVEAHRSGPVGFFTALPATLRVLWTIWFTVVCINLIVWGLVSLSNLDLTYFWPMWVIGPAGATLFGLSLAANAMRRSREDDRPEISG